MTPQRPCSAAPGQPATPHEQVVFCADDATGLRAIIGIYSTALGPALGGTRFHPYASEEDALADVLDLSRAMAYKNALAGLDHGGGKAVIIGDPAVDKTEALLRAYGRFVQSLGGRYVTACDVGTYVADMDVVARECPVRHRPLRGRRRRRRLVGAHGVRRVPGHAGLRRAPLGLADAGRPHRSASPGSARSAGTWSATCSTTAPPSWSPTSTSEAVDAVRREHPGVEVVADTDALVAGRPRRLRALRPRRRAQRRGRRGAAGAASSAAAPTTSWPTPASRRCCAERGILYAPDYCVNAGGVIQVADELRGLLASSGPRPRRRAIFDTTRSGARRLADDEGIPPAVAADRLAERRMAEVGRLRAITGRCARRPVRGDPAVGAEHPTGMYRWRTTRSTTSRGRHPLAAPLTYEGVEPWGAAEPRPSRPRSPAS